MKNAKFSKKYFFMNFQDMIIWFDLGENTSLRSVLKKISYSQNPYCRKAPSFRPHRRKKAFLKEFFSLKPDFHILGQQVLTKIFTWQESPGLILQNPTFDFFISCLVLDKFIFLCSLTYNPDFEITTFISAFLLNSKCLEFSKKAEIWILVLFKLKAVSILMWKWNPCFFLGLLQFAWNRNIVFPTV